MQRHCALRCAVEPERLTHWRRHSLAHSGCSQRWHCATDGPPATPASHTASPRTTPQRRASTNHATSAGHRSTDTGCRSHNEHETTPRHGHHSHAPIHPSNAHCTTAASRSAVAHRLHCSAAHLSTASPPLPHERRHSQRIVAQRVSALLCCSANSELHSLSPPPLAQTRHCAVAAAARSARHCPPARSRLSLLGLTPLVPVGSCASSSTRSPYQLPPPAVHCSAQCAD